MAANDVLAQLERLRERRLDESPLRNHLLEDESRHAEALQHRRQLDRPRAPEASVRRLADSDRAVRARVVHACLRSRLLRSLSLHPRLHEAHLTDGEASLAWTEHAVGVALEELPRERQQACA